MREDAQLPDRTGAASTRSTRARRIRQAVERLEPGLRVIAENVLAHHSRIDLVVVDGRRRAIAVSIAEPDAGSRVLATALAHRSWLLDHVGDWLKFAPELAIDTAAAVRTWVIDSDFDPELIVAASALPDGWIEFWRVVEMSRGDTQQSHLLAVPIQHRNGAVARPGRTADGRAELPRFRTGLTASDLGLTDEEIAQFE